MVLLWFSEHFPLGASWTIGFLGGEEAHLEAGLQKSGFRQLKRLTKAAKLEGQGGQGGQGQETKTWLTWLR